MGEDGNSEKINKPKKSTKVSPTSSEKQLNISEQVKAPQKQSPHEEGNSEKINKPKKSTKGSPQYDAGSSKSPKTICSNPSRADHLDDIINTTNKNQKPP